jgi:putative DNA methylase
MDVRPLLAEIVRDRVKTLMAKGVTGADLVIACIGAGLCAYTQSDRGAFEHFAAIPWFNVKP